MKPHRIQSKLDELPKNFGTTMYENTSLEKIEEAAKDWNHEDQAYVNLTDMFGNGAFDIYFRPRHGQVKFICKVPFELVENGKVKLPEMIRLCCIMSMESWMEKILKYNSIITDYSTQIPTSWGDQKKEKVMRIVRDYAQYEAFQIPRSLTISKEVKKLLKRLKFTKLCELQTQAQGAQQINMKINLSYFQKDTTCIYQKSH